jgi:nucleoside-diphosphate-sugar epimerase
MTASPLVVVTGSAGRIGRAVVQELRRRGRPVRGFDLVPSPDTPDHVVGSLTDAGAVARAMQGAGTLIHLAATPDDDDFVTALLPNNLLGVYHVLEAARAAGVRRLVLASSGQVVWWQRLRGEVPIGVDVQPTPRGWYACTKLFVEGAGRSFSEAHGLSAIAVRLGWCPRTVEQAREIAAADWAQDVYLSPGDAGRFFACTVEAPESLRWAVLYATSKPPHRPSYDLEPTSRLVGFEPRDTWPRGVEEMLR